MNYIQLRKNNLCVENISALKLATKYKTPFYCYSLSQLKDNFNRFNNTFKTINPIICFSVKSNSNLTILSELKKIKNNLDKGVMKVFNVNNSVNSKSSYGGTSTKNIKKMISKLKKEFK